MGGLKREGGRAVNIALDKGKERTASHSLTEKQRVEFYKTQFTSTLYYATLKSQFTKDELDYYLEEWGSLSIQFEDVVATEKRQIDEYIKMTILGNKILRNINVIEGEITILQQNIEEYRKKHPEIEADILAQEQDNQMIEMVNIMNGQAKSIANDYHRNLDLRTKLLQELNARRKDRVDQITKRGSTFLSILEEYRDKEVRAQQGRYMELMKMAAAKKKAQWRKPTRYDDGTLDCVLMDEYSELPQGELSMASSGEKSKVLESFAKLSNRQILVVEDDMARKQFFAHVFKDHTITWSSNAETAIGELDKNFDLVCLDYDLGLESTSKEIVDHIIKNNLCAGTYFLVHSENPKGAIELVNTMKGYSVEQCPFYQLKKDFIDAGTTTQESSINKTDV